MCTCNPTFPVVILPSTSRLSRWSVPVNEPTTYASKLVARLGGSASRRSGGSASRRSGGRASRRSGGSASRRSRTQSGGDERHLFETPVIRHGARHGIADSDFYDVRPRMGGHTLARPLVRLAGAVPLYTPRMDSHPAYYGVD